MRKNTPQFWILSSNKQTLLEYGICQSEVPKSAVIVGLPHNPLKILPHWWWLNFWLTVLTGISDPELVFGCTSLHAMMCVLTNQNSKDWSLADKVLKKTPLELQKRFPIYHVCRKYLAALLCGSAFQENGLAFHQDLDEVGKRLVD